MKIKILSALLKSTLATLLVVLLLTITTRHIALPTTQDDHLAAMTYHKPIPLTNENMVDVLTEHVDTTNLHAIHLKHELLEVELLMNNDQSVDEQLYRVVPLYVALAFHYSSNVEQLSIKVLREGRSATEHFQLMQLTIHNDDEWLQEGVQQLQDQAWLDTPYWMNALRIKKNWQLNYEI